MPGIHEDEMKDKFPLLWGRIQQMKDADRWVRVALYKGTIVVNWDTWISPLPIYTGMYPWQIESCMRLHEHQPAVTWVESEKYMEYVDVKSYVCDHRYPGKRNICPVNLN